MIDKDAADETTTASCMSCGIECTHGACYLAV